MKPLLCQTLADERWYFATSSEHCPPPCRKVFWYKGTQLKQMESGSNREDPCRFDSILEAPEINPDITYAVFVQQIRVKAALFRRNYSTEARRFQFAACGQHLTQYRNDQRSGVLKLDYFLDEVTEYRPCTASSPRCIACSGEAERLLLGHRKPTMYEKMFGTTQYPPPTSGAEL